MSQYLRFLCFISLLSLCASQRNRGVRTVLEKRLDNCPRDVHIEGFASGMAVVGVQILSLAQYQTWVRRGRPISFAVFRIWLRGGQWFGSYRIRSKGSYMLLVHALGSVSARLQEVPESKNCPDLMPQTYRVSIASKSTISNPDFMLYFGTERIIRGKPAPKEFAPYNAIIRFGKNLLCTGSVIAERWVLTAGHCPIPEGAKVIAGLPAASTKVERVYRHPQFASGRNYMRNDIAILRLEDPIPGSKKFSIAINSIQDKPSAGLYALMSGYGRTPYRVDFKLRSTISRVLTMQNCRTRFRQDGYPAIGRLLMKSMHLCTGKDGCSGGMCNGDSGGALVVKSPNGKIVQVGIGSFSVGACLKRRVPDVYTRVSSYVSWIRKVTDGAADIV